MSRLLFFAAVVAAVYLLLNSYRNRAAGEKTHGRETKSGQAENMVRCAYCGVHLPKSESVMAEDKYFCSDAHRRAYQPPPASNDVG